VLDGWFGGTPPPLPFDCLQVVVLHSDSCSVRTEAEYAAHKRVYDQLVALEERLGKAIPRDWPCELPNLSTHDGKPVLRVSSERDYTLVMRAYTEYLRRLETLKRGWTASLRAMITWDSLHQHVMAEGRAL